MSEIAAAKDKLIEELRATGSLKPETLQRIANLLDGVERFIAVPEADQCNDPEVGAVLENARFQLVSAETLRTAGSIRPATSLTIVAIEEYAKAVALRWRKFGLIEDIGKLELQQHRYKQNIFLLYTAIQAIKPNLYALINYELTSQQRALVFCLSLIFSKDFVFDGILIRADGFSGTKNAGLYSDPSGDYEEPVNPEAKYEYFSHRARSAADMAIGQNIDLLMMALFHELSRDIKSPIWRSRAEIKANVENLVDSISALRDKYLPKSSE